MSHVFISYSRIDSPFAEQISAIFEELGVNYFLDVKDINWGESITTRIQNSLSTCDTVLVIISPASLKSNWVAYEIGHTSALKKTILPFLTHPSLELPHYIKDLNWLHDLGQVRRHFETLKKERTFALPIDAHVRNRANQQSGSFLLTNFPEVLAAFETPEEIVLFKTTLEYYYEEPSNYPAVVRHLIRPHIGLRYIQSQYQPESFGPYDYDSDDFAEQESEHLVVSDVTISENVDIKSTKNWTNATLEVAGRYHGYSLHVNHLGKNSAFDVRNCVVELFVSNHTNEARSETRPT